MWIDFNAAVAAETLRPGTSEMPLPTGDMIHGLNGTTVASMADLREDLAKLAPGDAVDLPIERYGQLVYVSSVM
jgi:S1-C subfamily serine protease